MIKDILTIIIFPFPTLFKTTQAISEKIKKLINSSVEKPYSYEYASNNIRIDEKVLLDTLKDTIENKKILEDKAKSTLIAITISSSLIINILRYIQDMKDSAVILSIILAIVGFLSLLYMIVAGVLSLYSIGEINTVAIMYPEDYLLPQQGKNTQIADNIEHNYLHNLKRNNFMTTSYKCIITSISLLVVIFIIATVTLRIGHKKDDLTQEINRQIESINNKISTMSNEISEDKQNIIRIQQRIIYIIERIEITQQKLDNIKESIESINKIIADNPSMVSDEIEKLLFNLEKELKVE
ncbi:hypothetical protein [Alkaliphilus serpentinus]|uniref:Uncharacterized protein n=1 Tax=Alkaliphilus serpentinus TaxID=1482731 RepID=A0A833HM46_9FIRM|nr:hypothetical protein [Alkaliphilus serpentinus]KAB3527201.1 hypothetical protein F8153_12830 [Alkaliphilus serpentinus]